MVVLPSVRGLADVEPADLLRQHHNRRERRSRHHLRDAFFGDPLKAH